MHSSLGSVLAHRKSTFSLDISEILLQLEWSFVSRFLRPCPRQTRSMLFSRFAKKEVVI